MFHSPRVSRMQRLRLAQGTWVRLQRDLTKGMEVLAPSSSNICPLGHQIRVFEPAIAQVLSFGAAETTGPAHPLPILVLLSTAV